MIPHDSRVSWADWSLIATIGLFWGLNWVAVKILLSELPPWTLRSIAFAAGAVLLALIARGRGESLRPAAGELRWILLAGILTVFGFNIMTAYGQLLTETSKAAIVAFTMPVWASALSVAFLGERMTPARLLAIALGMAALALLLFEGGAGPFLDTARGPLVVLGAAVSWAAGTVVLKSRSWSLLPIARATWLVGVCVPPTLLGALLLERPWEQPALSTGVALTLLYHIVGPMVICHAAWVLLVARLPASVAAIGTLLIPVVGVGSASLAFGEPLTWQKLLALALVLASIAIALIAPARRKKSGPLAGGPA